MEKPDEKEVLQLAIDHYGIQAQLNKLVEECAELIVAIRHHQDRQRDPIEMLMEMADVEIMLAQMRMHYGDFFIDRERGKKVTRLAERMGLISIPFGKVSISPAKDICILYEDEPDDVEENDKLYKKFKVKAQGDVDCELEAIPVNGGKNGIPDMVICADDGAVYITKDQAKDFWGLKD